MQEKRFTTPDLLQIFDKITTECKGIMQVKNSDYTGTKGDQPFANFERCEYLGLCDTKIGMLVRMSDKFCRLITYCKSGKLMVPGEGYEDAVKDMINYLVLFYAYLLEEQMRVSNMKHDNVATDPISEEELERILKNVSLAKEIVVPDNVGVKIDLKHALKSMERQEETMKTKEEIKKSEIQNIPVPLFELSEEAIKKLREQGFNDQQIEVYRRNIGLIRLDWEEKRNTSASVLVDPAKRQEGSLNIILK